MSSGRGFLPGEDLGAVSCPAVDLREVFARQTEQIDDEVPRQRDGERVHELHLAICDERVQEPLGDPAEDWLERGQPAEREGFGDEGPPVGVRGRIAGHEAREERKPFHELGEQLRRGRSGARRDRIDGREARRVLRDRADVVVPSHDPESERIAPEHGLLAASARVERARIVDHRRSEREMLSAAGRPPSARRAGFGHEGLLRHADDRQFYYMGASRPSKQQFAEAR